ncbi:PREDICTED: uncharacterized protein LOC109178313 isoform X2 [Ipomoea nil]|uniref:uncharacterized protein LOC109178313 isoform X2 n=1 Tax=Ipomoea nil TaxID=35883 RepID=UPI0009012D92|nr:PREDICTED: uncharacterized protein LOC109178313 isoform X2 [Ipomoea nil]
MGCRKGALAEEENAAAAAAAVSEVLLFTTMCIIGLPVDVHVKDGSIYSGIFHTACVEDSYAIVLKKAMMVKKGTRKANVTSGSVVDTLVILSEDLAQIVAKGITLPADGIPGYVKGDDGGAIADDIPSNEAAEREAKSAKPNESSTDAILPNRKKDAQDSMKDRPTDNGESPVFQQGKIPHEARGSNPHCESLANASSDFPLVSLVKIDQNFEQKNIHERRSIEISQSSATPPSSVLKDGTPIAGVTSKVPPRSSSCNKAAKESKLNPGAKIFRPSIGHHRAVNPPAVPTMAYAPDSCPVLPVATPEPEVEISPFVPRSSVPIKFVQCNNMVAGNGNIDVQYAQPAMGYMGSRAAPTRYASQYHQLQAGSGYVHPNSENVMVGRLGPVLYVHPVSHGIVQGASGFSQVSSCPLLNPHQAHLPKHQGNATAQTLPVCMTPPFINGAQQTYTMPSQIPISHPSFPVLRPMQVPGSNGFFSPKFA